MKKHFSMLLMLLCCIYIGQAQNITFPDPNLKDALVNYYDFVIDTNRDGEISIEEANVVEAINISNNEISDLTGIEHFENLKVLIVSDNPLTKLDISKNNKLERLDARNSQLTELDVTKNINLLALTLGNNLLTELNVSQNINLATLSVYRNQLTKIDVSKNVNLTGLFLHYNQLTELDISKNTQIERLYIQDNLLSKLDARSCKIEEIHFSGNLNLKEVFLTNQPLTYRSRNGRELLNVFLSNCPSLQFICADQEYLSDINELLGSRTNCLLSSDCSTPYNKIAGTVTFDKDKDGCDSSDLPFTGEMNVVIQPNNGPAFTAFPNDQGEYSFLVPDGEYRALFPRVRNNTYYQFAENYSQRDISIPDDIDGLTTDFCIQPRADITDLEIEIIPLNRARPGFTSEYLIFYKNIGTLTETISITLDYQQDVLTYQSSSTPIDTDSNGQLTWDLGEVSPMSTGEIKVSFKLNTPTDSPALNNGDVLAYTVNVSSNTDDNTPDNNTLTLNQEVVNSYDPNDKTCLEGDILDPDDVGKYIHYLIRFENKGTAEAVNVRIEDIIDTKKLNIKSLVPIKGSHPFTTTITNKNKVEFWFNNINLPFDDANNDGYVLFKIRTKKKLVEGDEIVNGAGIYFDFNPPVITEDEIVTVKREVTTEPVFEDYFRLSPNPAETDITLTILNDAITINEIILYDLYGYEAGFYDGDTRTFNLDHLYPDTYLMHIDTDKGVFVGRFIKL